MLRLSKHLLPMIQADAASSKSKAVSRSRMMPIDGFYRVHCPSTSPVLPQAQAQLQNHQTTHGLSCIHAHVHATSTQTVCTTIDFWHQTE